MQTTQTIMLIAPWCERCHELLEDVQRACDYNEIDFLLKTEGEDLFEKWLETFAITDLPSLIVDTGFETNIYHGIKGVNDFLILYLDE
jgi:hypothetical protein